MLPGQRSVTRNGVRSALMIVACLLFAANASAQGDLPRARSLYNAGNFDSAIEAASSQRSRLAAPASAALISARARLERYRRSNSADDLEGARTELATLDASTLSPQEVLEWQIGIAETLYIDNQPGPASEWFRALLPWLRTQLKPGEVEKLLEWWAASTSRLAEGLPANARSDRYKELLTMAEQELERNPRSASATYWLIVAARGAGDLNRAWNAAVSGWIRAEVLEGGAMLRGDIEQFVLQTIIPERAQAKTGLRFDAKPTVSEAQTMANEWRALTERWSGSD